MQTQQRVKNLILNKELSPNEKLPSKRTLSTYLGISLNTVIEAYNLLLDEVINSIGSFMEDLEKVKENPFITEEELLPKDISGLANHIVQLEQRLASYKKTEDQIKKEKDKLRQAMLENNVKSWETPNHIKITLVADVPEKTEIKQVFNEDKLKEENPKLYNSYLEDKEITKRGRRGYVKITLPKEDK